MRSRQRTEKPKAPIFLPNEKIALIRPTYVETEIVKVLKYLRMMDAFITRNYEIPLSQIPTDEAWFFLESQRQEAFKEMKDAQDYVRRLRIQFKKNEQEKN